MQVKVIAELSLVPTARIFLTDTMRINLYNAKIFLYVSMLNPQGSKYFVFTKNLNSIVVQDASCTTAWFKS